MDILNYKYEIFPTAPQRCIINGILRQTKVQWNKAVTIQHKLKTALLSGQIEHVLNACLSTANSKNDRQAKRNEAILKLQAFSPGLDFSTAARLYDVRNVVGNLIDPLTPDYLNMQLLAATLKHQYDSEVRARQEARCQGKQGKQLPPLRVYRQLLRAISQASGYQAKLYMDRSFEPKKGLTLSTVRFNISGSAKALRWNQAVNPSREQRNQGATGNPVYKKRGLGFTYQNNNCASLIRGKRGSGGHQIRLAPLYEDNAWVDMVYHRPLPEGSVVKQITVNSTGAHYYAVLSLEVPDNVMAIPRVAEGWHAGIDPGVQTALTVALHNARSGQSAYLALHYDFLDRKLARLETLQHALLSKRGPRRKLTDDEIAAALERYSSKRAIKHLPAEALQQAIEKEKSRLGKKMVFQEPSNNWRKAIRRVGELHRNITNKRADVLHKISRALAESCDMVGIGHWEPEREISYRKKLRAAEKAVRLGLQDAANELQALLEEKSKNGAKGSKSRRRSGRDRSIATLRRMVFEKCARSGAHVEAKLNEAGSTKTCSSCLAETGPSGADQLSVRVWTCSACGSAHHRDINSGFNILRKLENTAAQAVSSETGSVVARTSTHGASRRSASCRVHARGSNGKGDNFVCRASTSVPNLFSAGVSKSLNSLSQMGIIRPLTMKAGSILPPEEGAAI